MPVTDGSPPSSTGNVNEGRQRTEVKASYTDAELRRLLMIDPTSITEFDRRSGRSQPSSGFLTPSAYGAAGGNAFLGFGGVAEGNNTELDGSSSVGIGLGNSTRSVGVEVSAGIISLRDEFGQDGVVGVKLHRILSSRGALGVAVGWSNAVKWGDAEGGEDTFYGVLSRKFALRPDAANTLPLTASIGVGTGSFRTLDAITDGENTANVFGSLGLLAHPNLSVVTSWTGSALGAGVSTVPGRLPVVLTLGVSDITDRTSAGPRFQGSLGYTLKF